MSRVSADERKRQDERHQRILKKLLNEEPNKFCADCGAKGPRWASWNLGAFLCIRCAGIHRNLGVHISRVKSTTLDSWTPEQIDTFQSQGGNDKVNMYYEANLPSHFRRPIADYDAEQFIRAKYERKEYVAGGRSRGGRGSDAEDEYEGDYRRTRKPVPSRPSARRRSPSRTPSPAPHSDRLGSRGSSRYHDDFDEPSERSHNGRDHDNSRREKDGYDRERERSHGSRHRDESPRDDNRRSERGGDRFSDRFGGRPHLTSGGTRTTRTGDAFSHRRDRPWDDKDNDSRHGRASSHTSAARNTNRAAAEHDLDRTRDRGIKDRDSRSARRNRDEEYDVERDRDRHRNRGDPAHRDEEYECREKRDADRRQSDDLLAIGLPGHTSDLAQDMASMNLGEEQGHAPMAQLQAKQDILSLYGNVVSAVSQMPSLPNVSVGLMTGMSPNPTSQWAGLQIPMGGVSAGMMPTSAMPMGQSAAMNMPVFIPMPNIYSMGGTPHIPAMSTMAAPQAMPMQPLQTPQGQKQPEPW